MRPYTRANHRPYPSAARARAQIRRAAGIEPCPLCAHGWNRHALDDDGQRACSRGLTDQRISCRDCAELAARMPAAFAMSEFARVWRTKPPLRAGLRLARALDTAAAVSGRR